MPLVGQAIAFCGLSPRQNAAARQTTKTDRLSHSHDAVWLRLRCFVLHPFEFFAARDDSAVTLAPEGRQIVAQCVSTGNGVKDRRAPERGGRTGDECFFRPVPGLANLLYGPRARALGYSLSPSGLREHFLVAACRSAGRAILPAAAFQAALSRRCTSCRTGKRRLKAGGSQDWLPHGKMHTRCSVCRTTLAPVSLHQDPAVLLVIPAMSYPVGTRTWRLFPPSRGPGVGVAIPTLVPGNPHMVTAGRRRPLLDYNTRWRDANHNIGRHGTEDHRACKNHSDQSFKNHKHTPFLSTKLRNHTFCAVLYRR